ncbi:MAG: hypothetical protein ABIO16_05595 [Nocardioides sp.]
MPRVGPAEGTGLVGREAELGALVAAQATRALVTITGLPAVGKSALVAEAGRRVAAAGIPVVLVQLGGIE